MSDDQHPSNPELDELYRSIGRFVYWFSLLDDAIRELIFMLLDLTDKQHESLMPVIDFRSACTICKVQAEIKFPHDTSMRDFVVDLVKRAQEAGEDRNKVAHACWYWHEGKQAALHTSRNNLREGSYFTEHGELDRKADEISILVSDIYRTIEEYRHGASPSGRTPSLDRNQ
jgi:hypothetical protein